MQLSTEEQTKMLVLGNLPRQKDKIYLNEIAEKAVASGNLELHNTSTNDETSQGTRTNSDVPVKQ